MPRKKSNAKAKVEEDVRRSDLDLEALDEDEEISADVKDIFEEAQQLDYGRRDLARKLESYTDRTPELSGGDIDAGWEYGDVGEEAVGGQNPTPDQSVVDEEGEAVGITYNDNEPLRTTDKLEQRDRDPWELNPASSLDYGERRRREFQSPIAELISVKPNGNRKGPKASSATRIGQARTVAASRKAAGTAPTRNSRKSSVKRNGRRAPSRTAKRR
ncbi:MAG: hypothetical protein HY782_15700 [Chloroflexi bacterium]|nr:hypothetical protein [Chloroflexota bacterium]